MALAEVELRALDVGIGGEIAFAARQRMIAGPERHAAFRRDEHEPVRRRGSCGPSTARRPTSAPATRTTASAADGADASQTRASGRKNSIAGRTRIAEPGERPRAEPTTPRQRPAVSARRDRARLSSSSTPRERDGAVQRLAEHVGRNPDERRIARGDERGRDAPAARPPARSAISADQPHADRADDGLRDLHARRRASCRPARPRRSSARNTG